MGPEFEVCAIIAASQQQWRQQSAPQRVSHSRNSTYFALLPTHTHTHAHTHTHTHTHTLRMPGTLAVAFRPTEELHRGHVTRLWPMGAPGFSRAAYISPPGDAYDTAGGPPSGQKWDIWLSSGRNPHPPTAHPSPRLSAPFFNWMLTYSAQIRFSVSFWHRK